MLKRLVLSAAVAFALAAPATAAPPPAQKVDIVKMMGRWYEVARVPNKMQNGCHAGASDWTRAGAGFAVVQSCRKGGPEGPLAQWKAKATVTDPETNARIRMTFFGGLLSQDYVILDHRLDQGWLILSSANGKYLWLMAQKPTLPDPVRAQAISRVRQLGFDASRLEFPKPFKG